LRLNHSLNSFPQLICLEGFLPIRFYQILLADLESYFSCIGNGELGLPEQFDADFPSIFEVLLASLEQGDHDVLFGQSTAEVIFESFQAVLLGKQDGRDG
jgi:hypothetical protein